MVEIEMTPEPLEDSFDKGPVEQIRICPHTGAVVGATKSSLVTIITNSPNHHDLTDFFLIYRLIITPHDLLRLLLDRLTKCLSEGESRPRSNVVHIVNTMKYWFDVFFADDFLPSFTLRSIFADTMSKMARKIKSLHTLEIIRRLRGAWHRQCQRYWHLRDVDIDISTCNFTPGGLAGRPEMSSTRSRHSTTDEDFKVPMTTSASSLIRGRLDGKEVWLEKKADSSGLLQTMRSALSLRSLHTKRYSNHPECHQSPLYTKKSRSNRETFIHTQESHANVAIELCSPQNGYSTSLRRASSAESASEYMKRDVAESTPSLDCKNNLNDSISDIESLLSSNKSDALVNNYDGPSPISEPTLRLKRKPGGNLRGAATLQKLWNRRTSVKTLSTQNAESLPSSPLLERSFAMGVPVDNIRFDVFDASDDEGVSVALKKLEGTFVRKDAANVITETSLDTSLEENVLDGPERRRRRQNQVIGVPADVRRVSNVSSLPNGSYRSLKAEIEFLNLPQSPWYQARTPSLGRAFYDPFLSARQRTEHVCFCLSYSVEEVVRQFTMLEKDAMLELDWMELLTFRWNTVSHDEVCDWKVYANSSRHSGIDMLISRFNLMTNWVISEIVSTASLKLRAQVVTRMIEIAAKAKLMRNFATCVQVMAALQSQKVARLTATWAKIPSRCLRHFRELQIFTMPQRNWRNLRLEMEVDDETATIPFIIVYLSDLVFNAERPDYVPASGYDETMSLIHYEKHRNTAQILKRLLRAIHQSTRYNYLLIDGLWEACLWVTALREEELWECSFAVET